MKRTITLIVITTLCLSAVMAWAQQPTPPAMAPAIQDQQRITSLEQEHRIQQLTRELLKFHLREAEQMNAKADIEAIQVEYSKAGERLAEIQKEYKRLMDAQKMREQAEKAKKPEVPPATTNPAIDMPPTPTQTEGAH